MFAGRRSDMIMVGGGLSSGMVLDKVKGPFTLDFESTPSYRSRSIF